VAYLIDTNVWLAAIFDSHVHHQVAGNWIGQSTEPLAFCRSTQISLLRLVTSEAVFGPEALTNRKAQTLLLRLLDDDRIFLAEESPDIEKVWFQYAAKNGRSPSLWMDAYLAAFAVRHGFQIVTFDSGFHQFSGVKLRVLP
jgi:uncharacterized protein